MFTIFHFPDLARPPVFLGPRFIVLAYLPAYRFTAFAISAVLPVGRFTILTYLWGSPFYFSAPSGLPFSTFFTILARLPVYRVIILPF